jgi:hypothetical protein
MITVAMLAIKIYARHWVPHLLFLHKDDHIPKTAGNYVLG